MDLWKVKEPDKDENTRRLLHLGNMAEKKYKKITLHLLHIQLVQWKLFLVDIERKRLTWTLNSVHTERQIRQNSNAMHTHLNHVCEHLCGICSQGWLKWACFVVEFYHAWCYMQWLMQWLSPYCSLVLANELEVWVAAKVFGFQPYVPSQCIHYICTRHKIYWVLTPYCQWWLGGAWEGG